MTMVLCEIEGVSHLVRLLHSIIGQDPDSPLTLKSKDLLESCNEILENYIGIENDFTDPYIKEIYNHLLLDLLESIIDKTKLLAFIKLQLKNVQLCEHLDDYLILHIGDKDGSQ